MSNEINYLQQQGDLATTALTFKLQAMKIEPLRAVGADTSLHEEAATMLDKGRIAWKTC